MVFYLKLKITGDTFLVATRVCAFVKYRAVRKIRKIMLNRVLLLRPIKQLQPRLTLAYLGAVYLRSRTAQRVRSREFCSKDAGGFWNTPSKHYPSPSQWKCICEGKFEANEWDASRVDDKYGLSFFERACRFPRRIKALVHLDRCFSTWKFLHLKAFELEEKQNKKDT